MECLISVKGKGYNQSEYSVVVFLSFECTYEECLCRSTITGTVLCQDDLGDDVSAVPLVTQLIHGHRRNMV